MRTKNVIKTGAALLAIWLSTGLAELNGQDRFPIVPYPQELNAGKRFYTPSGDELSLRISGMEGENLDVIKGFAGDDAELAKYYPEDKDFLLEFEPRVVHYEVVGQS